MADYAQQISEAASAQNNSTNNYDNPNYLTGRWWKTHSLWMTKIKFFL